MTQARSRELLLRVKAGDEEARDAFIRENLRLVLSVIQRFAGRSEQMDDLFQVGCIGLIKALDNFDLSHNVRFSTYAVPMNITSRKGVRRWKESKGESSACARRRPWRRPSGSCAARTARGPHS